MAGFLPWHGGRDGDQLRRHCGTEATEPCWVVSLCAPDSLWNFYGDVNSIWEDNQIIVSLCSRVLPVYIQRLSELPST